MVSPYARPHGVTNVVHDHTSVLKTIEEQWNLPALTFRDANAASLGGLLGHLDDDVRRAARPGQAGQCRSPACSRATRDTRPRRHLWLPWVGGAVGVPGLAESSAGA